MFRSRALSRQVSSPLVRARTASCPLIGAGVTVHHCLRAADELAAADIAARVLDMYSVKLVDVTALNAAAEQTGQFIVVEDHYPQSGLGSAVLEALADAPHRPRIVQLAVAGVPGSGSAAEVMDAAGITAPHIVAAVRQLLGRS